MSRPGSSLRAGLLVRLGSAMVLLLAIDGLIAYFTALHFATLVYDRWLTDSARALAQTLRTGTGRVQIELPLVAQQIVQFDEIDRTWFRVSSRREGFIAGDRELPYDPAHNGGPSLRFAQVHGAPVRQVTTHIAPPGAGGDEVTISVAETLLKRNALTREILLGMAAPQGILLAIGLLLAWLGVALGLKPLTDLASRMEARDPNSLASVPETGLPREAQPLVQQLNGLLRRVENVVRAQNRFLADAAHQLRTPLAAVLLHAEQAERAADPASERAAFAALHRSIDRAARLSGQLLALARTDPEATVPGSFGPLDLAALARRVGEDWVPRALTRNIDFGLVVPDAPVTIRGNAQLLEELLSNLIDNALRYGPTGGRVTVSVEARGPGATLSVQDEGPGIPAAERARIFERFYRVADATGEGCGLGLAIVEEIARRHDAQVEVGAGQQGQGARFSVRFPRAAGTDLR